jgi:hypothetical protein
VFKEDSLSLSEEAHLNILSLRPILYFIFFITFLLFVILWLLVTGWLDMNNVLMEYGSLKLYYPPGGEFNPFNAQDFPTDLLNEVIVYHAKILIIIVITFAGLMLSAIYFFFHVRKKIKNLERWDTNNVKQSYFIVFQTTIPVGDTMGEKIFHLAKHVYPELRSDIPLSDPSVIERIEWYLQRFISYLSRRKRDSEQEMLSKALNYRIDSYILDLVLKTKHGGVFIVKYFGNKTVRFNDLNELIKIVKKKFGTKMWTESRSFRVICVAREYDSEILPKLKDLVTTENKIDLLVEEENGFSVLWVG